MVERKEPNPECLNIGLFNAYEMDHAEGGVKENIGNTALYLRKRGHTVSIIAPKNQGLEYTGSEIIYLGKASDHKTNGTITPTDRSPESFSKIRLLHETLNLDVAHYHEPEISAPSLQSLWISKAVNFATFHAYNEKHFNLKYYLISRLRFLFDGKLSGKLLVSEAQRPFAEYYYPGEFKVISNGIDTEKFKPTNQKIERFADGKVNILFVGRLEERKGLKHLLPAYKEAKAKYPNLRLIIVGSGPQREELESIVESEGIEDVCFEGQVPAKEKPNYYATADIFCSPATGGESFGIVLLEAMATGVPVIAGDNPGYRTVVTGEEGLLVNPADTHQFARYIVQLALSKTERTSRGEAGLKKAQDYTWPKKVGELEEYYLENLLQKQAKQRNK